MDAGVETIITYDINGLVVGWNGGAESVFGYSAEAMLGHSITHVIAPEMQQQHHALLQRMGRGEQVDPFESLRLTQSGRRLALAITIHPVRDATGSLVAFCEVGRVAGASEMPKPTIAQTAVPRKRTDIDTLAATRWRDIVDSMFAFVGLFSPDGLVLEFNAAAGKATGAARENVLGHYAWDTSMFAYSRKAQDAIRHVLLRVAAGEKVRQEFIVRLAGEQLRVVDATFSPLRDASGAVIAIVGSGVDVTPRKDAEDAQLTLNRELRMLSDCKEILVRATNEQAVLDGICKAIVKVGGFRFAWIGYARHDAGKSVRPTAQAGFEAGYLEKLAITWEDSERGRGPTGRAIREREAIVCQRIDEDPLFAPWRSEAQRRSYASSVALPFTVGSADVGVISIYSSRPEAFRHTELQLMRELAADLGYGITVLRARAEHERTESQRRLFRRLLDCTTDMIYVAEAESGRILDANEAVSKSLGYTREELLEMSVTQITLGVSGKSWSECVDETKAAGSLVIEGNHRHRDGGLIAVEISASYVEREHKPFLIIVTRNISERQRQQDQITRLTRILKMQSGINAAVLRIRDRDELLQEACRLAAQVGGYDRASVALVTPDGRHAESRFHAGEAQHFPSPALLEISDGTEPDTTLASRALRTGEVVVASDLTQSEPPLAFREQLLAGGFKSLVSLPLIADATRIGVLTLASRDVNRVRDDELLLLQDMAATLSFALQYQQKEHTVQFLASFDPLTGLAKRALFCERLDNLLRNGFSLGASPVVAAFDVHQLSHVNDTFGRHVGDLLLQKVAERLKQNSESDQHIGYLGSGTFVLAKSGLSSTDANIGAVLESIVFGEPFEIEGRVIRVSCRSGVARYRIDGEACSTLVNKAEAALKQAKEAGEPFLHYGLQMHSEIAERLALEHKLRTAIDEQQFVLYYQPQINIETRRVESLEALLRWHDPQEGIIAPERFLSVLESSGLIASVGRWVFARVAQDCRRWRHLRLGPVRVAVNVSALQVRRRSFVKQVLGAAEGWSGEGYGLDLEITETGLLQDIEGTSRKLRELRDSGIRIAIDDFGTGYSSLGLLAKLPVDLLKIDRTFISGLPNDEACMMLASSIIRLGSALKLITVAEGVETAEQLAVLRGLNCDQSQGFLHAPPVPAEEIDQVLTAGFRRDLTLVHAS